jgi:DNA-damage-inducible protein J
MKTTAVTFRMDAELKEKTENILEEIGLPMSSAFTAFAKAIVRTGSIPFDLTIDPFYRVEHQHELARRIERCESGQTKMVDRTEEFEDA